VKTQARIISDVLDVSRINSGKLQLYREAVDPAAVIADSLVSLRASVDEKSLQVDRSGVESSPAAAWLDPARFQQVFWNLMTNAIKFSEAGGEIRVALRREGERLLLSVQDFGQGVAPEFLPHLFERFTQGEPATNRAHGGLGLGLSIVQHIAELHGGEARAFSAGIGQGCTMTVEFLVGPPAAADGADSEPDGDEPLPELPALRGCEVLVVEDDRDSREMLQMVLQDRGAVVRTAADYAGALAALAAHWPDALVCDIGLPERDGYEVIREARRLQPAGLPRLPAVALTSFTRTEDRTKALEAGFDLHVPKPLKPHLLLAAIALLRAPPDPTPP
jgi:CheY-like chemotaxis protein